jgi:hypothetical protein
MSLQHEPGQLETDSSIAGLLNQLYAVISFEEGDEPDWQGLTEVFSQHARITRITPEGTDYMDPANFLAMTRNMVDLGAYTSFYEVEVARAVECFGEIAQVWSMYETRRGKYARDALGRGVNSIQLIRERGVWRVLGLLWDESKADPRLERARVFAKGGARGQD